MSTQKQFDKNNFSFLALKDKLICVSLVTLVFFLDRISKIKIINHQLDNERVYINDFINLDLVWNTGIGFGLFSLEAGLYYNILSIIICLVILTLIIFSLKGLYLANSLLWL